jgi:hypothetical protein
MGSAGSVMDRPRCQPRWNAAIVLLAASGDGAGSSAPG